MGALKRIVGLLALLSAGAAIAAADPDSYMPTELIAETHSPKPGSTVLLGFKMSPRSGWHGYWSNPGDAGIVPTVRWTAPSGVTFGPLLHPAPKLISDSGISSFVHEGKHMLLTRMRVPAPIEPGTPIPVEAKLDWAACTATQCVPLSATFSLDLVAGGGAKSAQSAALRSALGHLPKEAPVATYSVTGGRLRLHIPGSLRLNPRTLRFFPDENDAFPTAESRASKSNGGIVIEALTNSAPPQSLTGVLSDGRSAYRIRFSRGKEPMAEPQKEQQPMAEPRAGPQVDTGQGEHDHQPVPGPTDDGLPITWRWIALAGALLTVGAFVFARRA